MIDYPNGLASYVFDFLNREFKNIEGNYLEIGVFDGRLLQSIAENYPDKIAVGIDPFIEDGCTSWLSSVEKGGNLENQKDNTLTGNKKYSNIDFYQMTSEEFYNQLTNKLIKKLNIRVVFIDGEHSYEAASLDYKLALKLIGDNKGIIIFDDLQVEGVLKACNEFTKFAKEKIKNRINIFETAAAFYIN